MESVIIQLLKEREQDNEFIESCYNELIKEYSNKFIAVKNKEIIAHGSDFEKVLKQVKKKEINPSLTVIRFIFDKGHKFIL